MNLTFINGTTQQQQWVRDAVAACMYHFDSLDVQVNVQFTALTGCTLSHTYMCTNQQGPSLFLIQVEPWADDPTNINNAGLPDPIHDLHEFFMEAFVHELGHVVSFFLINTDALKTQMSHYFVHRTGGRRGTLQDWLGPESDKTWGNKITEAVAEWFRLAYLPETPIYWNRTNWELSPADFHDAFMLLNQSGAWVYDKPVEMAVGIELLDGGTLTIPATPFVPSYDIPLGYASQFNDLTDRAAHPSYAWDYDVSVGGIDAFAGMKQGPSVWAFPEHGGLFLSAASPGGDFPFIREPLIFDEIHDPTQPWATSLPTEAGGPSISGDLVARSGWTGYRGAVLEWDLPVGHGWGMVELSINGYFVPVGSLYPTWTNYGALASEGTDTHGVTTDQFADTTTPWDSAPPTDVADGPFPDGYPPSRESGWLVGVVWKLIHQFRTDGALGNVEWYTNVSDRAFHPPDVTVPSPPSPPSDLGGPPVGPLITDPPLLILSARQGQWDVETVLPFDGDTAYPASPLRASGKTILAWTGPITPADSWTNFDISARFFPVIRRSGGPPPPFPSRLPGNANAGPQQGGTLRSRHAAGLARRALEIVNRLNGGGGSSKA